MRILLVSDLYPPVLGGLELYVQTLGRELAARGHHVAVATLTEAGSTAAERAAGVQVHRLRGWNRALGSFYESPQRRLHLPIPDPGVVAGLRRLLSQQRPDVVHAHGWILYSVLALAPGRDFALIAGLHDYGLVCAKKTLVHRGAICSGPAYVKCVRCARGQYGAAKGLALTSGLLVSARLHRRVDRYVANSRAVAAASARRAAGVPIEVVPPFVDEDAIAAAAKAPRPSFLPEGEFLLFVGALGAHKGLDVLLAAYQQLPQSVPLVLLGTPRSDTPARFPSGVTIVRDVPHEQVLAAWNHCLLGVVPSIWPEPFGQVAVEAMASGRPVVASNIGGLSDVVDDDVTGVLVAPGDAVALRDAIARLVSDPGRRERLGQAGRRRAQLFTVRAAADRLVEIYSRSLPPARD